MICPNCKKDNKRVLFRPHWSLRYHEFICGNCRLEFDLLFFNISDQKEVDTMYKNLLEFEYYDELQDLRKKIREMSEEQLLTRLEELKRKS